MPPNFDSIGGEETGSTSTPGKFPSPVRSAPELN
jgi:hypothetical protein